MLEEIYFEDFQNFMEWWKRVNPRDPLDLAEAMEIYFNQDIYGAIL
jgi:hypothetical protein